MKNKIIVFVLIAFMSCKNDVEKPVYYKTTSGKIFKEAEYDSIKDKMSKKGEVEEVILSTEVKKDSIIKIFQTKLKRLNPYKKMERFIGKKHPFNNLKTIEGKEIKLNNGKSTFVNLWFINCRPCIEEIPVLNKMKNKYANKVNFLALTFETKEDVSSFLEKRNFNFEHIVDSKDQINRLDNNNYPLSLYIDKKGVIRFYEGFLTNVKEDGTNLKLEKIL